MGFKGVLYFLLMFFYVDGQASKVDSLLNLLSASKSDSTKQALYNELALEHLNIDYQKVLDYSSEGYKLADKRGDIRSAGDFLRLMGSVYGDLGVNDQALENLEKAYQIFESLEDSSMMSRALNNIGSIYWTINDYQQAKSFYKKANYLATKAGNIRVAQGTEMNLGLIYFESGEYDSALVYMQNALKKAKANNYRYSVALTLMNMGEVYKKQGKNNKSLQLYDTVYQHYLNDLTPPLRLALHYSIARIHMGEGNFENAGYFLKLAENWTDNAIGIVVLKDYYATLFQFDTLIGDYRSAVKNLMRLSEVEDTLQKSKFKSDLANFQVKFKTNEKEKENQLLKSSLEMEKVTAQKRKILLLLIFIVLGFSLMFILIFYQQNNLKTAKNKIITKQNNELLDLNNKLQMANDTKNKFFSLVAHDIKNPFGSIMNLAEIIFKKHDQMEVEKRKMYLESLYKASKNTYEFLENLLVWARTQNKTIAFEPSNLNVNALVDETIQLFGAGSKNKKITITFKADCNHQIKADANMLKAILRNLIGNAIKYSSIGGNILVWLQSDGKWLKIMVEDEGDGMDAEQVDNLFNPGKVSTTLGTVGETGTGLGLMICDEFVKFHNGSIQVKSLKGKGTVFTVNLPV